MRIDVDFQGGNIRVLDIQGDTVYLENEIRDTMEDWFYWGFRVRGAAGRSLTFDFRGQTRVGYFGAAVSRDWVHWRWTDPDRLSPRYDGFSYTFSSDVDELYFCHDMNVQPSAFRAFANTLSLPLRLLCITEKGVEVPYIAFGEGASVLLLTSRHHCCESTGTWVMEGLLQELVADPIPGLRVIAVPFVDIDGVLAGDQGKSRAPHDHNRDYIEEPLYETTRALKRLAKEQPITYALDLHSPWHFGDQSQFRIGGYHDVGLFCCRIAEQNDIQHRLSALLEAETRLDADSFQYQECHNLFPGMAWLAPANEYAPVQTFADYMHSVGAALSVSLETPYFGTPDNPITEERLLRYGHALGRALRKLHIA